MQTSSIETVWRSWCGWSAQDPVSPEILSEISPSESRLYSPPSEEYASDPGPFQIAVVDKKFREVAEKHGVKPKPFWPDNRPYAFCLTHEIALSLSPLRHPKEYLASFVWSPLSLSKLEEWESSRGVRSASYVLVDDKTVPSIQDELDKYVKQGNELGLLASETAWRNGDLLLEERRTLQNIPSLSESPIMGARNLGLRWESEPALEAQNKAGLVYDSSMGFNRRNGFRCGTSFPFPWNSQWELGFQLSGAVPTAAVDSKVVLEETKKRGGVLVLNWPLEPGDLLGALIDEAKKDGAWITLPREVIAWWQERCR